MQKNILIFSMDTIGNFKRKVRGIIKNKRYIQEDDLETYQQYKERWRSIYIIYFTMFMISLGFSIIVTGVWPYLDKVRIYNVFLIIYE